MYSRTTTTKSGISTQHTFGPNALKQTIEIWLSSDQESVKLNFATRDRRGVAASLVGVAGVAVVQDQFVQAAQLLGAVGKLLNEIAAHLYLDDQREYELHLESVQKQLDVPTLNRAWAEGQSMTMEQAVTFATS
ncbi:MAG TPA: hypothetical protein VMT24_12330 [Aggregatilineaceae bacterium]|nr:hypothetical protein [Aggregatilineaceae bacterium]